MNGVQEVDVMVGKTQAIQAIETPHTANYIIKIGQTLFGATTIKTMGPKDLLGT